MKSLRGGGCTCSSQKQSITSNMSSINGSFPQDAPKGNQNITVQQLELENFSNNLLMKQQNVAVIQSIPDQVNINDSFEDDLKDFRLASQYYQKSQINVDSAKQQKMDAINNTFDVPLNIKYTRIMLSKDEQKVILWNDGQITIMNYQQGNIIKYIQNIDFTYIKNYQSNKILLIGIQKITILNIQNGIKQRNIFCKQRNLQSNQQSINEQYLVCYEEKLQVFQLSNLKLIKSYKLQNIQISAIKIQEQSSLIYLFASEQKLILSWNFINHRGYQIIYQLNDYQDDCPYYTHNSSYFSDDLQYLSIFQADEIVSIDIRRKQIVYWAPPGYLFGTAYISNRYAAVRDCRGLYISNLKYQQNSEYLLIHINQEDISDIYLSKLNQNYIILLLQGQIIKIWNFKEPFNQKPLKKFIIQQINLSKDGLILFLKVQNILLFCNLKTGLIYDSINHDFDEFQICQGERYIIFYRYNQLQLQYFEIETKQLKFCLLLNNNYQKQIISSKNNQTQLEKETVQQSRIVKLIQSQKENLICVIIKSENFNIEQANILILDNNKNIRFKYSIDSDNAAFNIDCQYFVYNLIQEKGKLKDNCLQIIKINQKQDNEDQFQIMKNVLLVTVNLSKENFNFIINQDDQLIAIFGVEIRSFDLKSLQETTKIPQTNEIKLFSHSILNGNQKDLFYFLNYQQILMRGGEGIQVILDTNNLQKQGIQSDGYISTSSISHSGNLFVTLKESDVVEVWEKTLISNKRRNIQMFISRNNIKLFREIFIQQQE